MKIQAGKIVSTLEGRPYKMGDHELTVGKVLAEALSQSETGGKMKMFLLAKRCWEDAEVEVDAADLALVKRSLESSKAFTNIILGQVLLELENVEEA